MKGLRIVVLGLSLTIVLAAVPNLYPVVMKEPKDGPKSKSRQDVTPLKINEGWNVKFATSWSRSPITMSLTTLSIGWTVAK